MSKLDDLINEPDFQSLIDYRSTKLQAHELLCEISGTSFLERIRATASNLQTLVHADRIFKSGRLSGSGYLSILAVDQGVEHSALFSFARNPEMFDPAKVFTFAVEAGMSAVAAPFGMIKEVGRQFADKIPLIAKINHNELLSVPSRWNQTKFANVRDAWNHGCVGIGFTVYFGSSDSRQEIEIARDMISEARELGMLVFCWCYPRNARFVTETFNCEEADDITAQAVYLGSTLGVDFVKQKVPRFTKGFRALKAEGYDVKTSDDMYKFEITHPIDMVRLQVLHAYAGRVGLLSSGGESGQDDEREIAKIAIINKRAGGRGLMVGRKLFKRSFADGLRLASLIHEIYLDSKINLA